jgi:hypothetical protein
MHQYNPLGSNKQRRHTVNGVIRVGQRVRVTLLTNVVATDDAAEVVAHAGARYEGTVIDMETDGAFELELGDGETLGFYSDDADITIEILADSQLPE